MKKKLKSIKTKVNLNKINVNKSKKIGEGAFGNVYYLSNNKRTNKNFVVKKIKKKLGLQIITFLGTGKTQKQLLDKEIDGIYKLSKLNITPNIYYYDRENMTYVIDSLDYDLKTMIENKKLTISHLKKIIILLKKLKKTNIKHNDLHSGNIMYSNKKKNFFIIDLGIYKIIHCENKEKDCYEFDEENALNLMDIFDYIKYCYKRKKNIKYKEIFKEYVKLFNIKDREFINKFLE